jgi:hypothetical protein
MEVEMVHDLIRYEKCPELSYGNEDDRHSSGYRFGRDEVTGPRKRSAWSRVHGYLKNLMEAVADVKIRRMRHELALRGVRVEQLNEAWMKDSRGDARRHE